MSHAPHVLLINPWIHDFAAYDFWAKPYGLLSLAAILRHHGVRISFIDCLDRFHPSAPVTDPRARHGRGPYLKTALPNPPALASVKRTYSRYGIDPQWFSESLAVIQPPDLILVTSIMTYWYPGVIETISRLKEVFPHTPVVLGGIYARLWTEHAVSNSGADHVAVDDGGDLFAVLKRFTGYETTPQFDFQDLDALPRPAFDLQHRIAYIPLLTGRGCPYDCAYCASRFLDPVMKRRSPQNVVTEIEYWHRHYGVVNFAFYDDALLVHPEGHAWPLLEAIIRKNLKLFFHTPNALHIREISAQTARLMYRAGFHTLRLGLETTAFDSRRDLDRKVEEEEFLRAVGHLKDAGFRPDQIGAYLLVGLPGQRLDAVQKSIDIVRQACITPVMAHYTPIPHTRLWDAACAASRYDLGSDPIFSNNAIMPCSSEDFDWQVLSRLKQSVKGG
jgi:hypothetical protein